MWRKSSFRAKRQQDKHTKSKRWNELWTWGKQGKGKHPWGPATDVDAPTPPAIQDEGLWYGHQCAKPVHGTFLATPTRPPPLQELPRLPVKASCHITAMESWEGDSPGTHGLGVKRWNDEMEWNMSQGADGRWHQWRRCCVVVLS